MALLFGALAAGLGLIAVAAWRGGAYPVAVASCVLAVWLATLAIRSAASGRRR
jgi:hypothetical protein